MGAATAASVATVVTDLDGVDAALEGQITEYTRKKETDEAHAGPPRETSGRAAGAGIVGAGSVLVRVFGAVVKVPLDAAHARRIVQGRLG